MMPAAEWGGELIADLAAERARLSKSEAVGSEGLRPHTRHACWVT